MRSPRSLSPTRERPRAGRGAPAPDDTRASGPAPARRLLATTSGRAGRAFFSSTVCGRRACRSSRGPCGDAGNNPCRRQGHVVVAGSLIEAASRRGDSASAFSTRVSRKVASRRRLAVDLHSPPSMLDPRTARANPRALRNSHHGGEQPGLPHCCFSQKGRARSRRQGWPPLSPCPASAGGGHTTLIAAWAVSGHGSDGSKVMWMALAMKKPPMCWAAISGGVPGLVWLTSWANT